MENDEYYDIDSILAEHTKIPCIFLHDIDADVNLTGDGSKVRRNGRVELPFWVAKPLAQFTLPNNENLVSIELPKTYGTRVRNMLEASPTSIDFRAHCPYFYTFGVKLLELVVDTSLATVLEETFKVRLREIMDFSQTSSRGAQDFLHKLDETEKKLYKAGQESALQLRQWRDRSLMHLKSIDLNGRPSAQ